MQAWIPAVLLAAATGAAAVERSDSQELRADLAPGQRLQIDSHVGEISVRGTAREGVVFHVRKTAKKAADADAALAALEEIDLDLEETDDGVVLRRRGPRWFSRDGRDTEVHIEAEVPRRVDLQVEIDVGRIEVDGIEGAVIGRADVGEIEMRDVAGSLDLRTRVGEIDAELVAHDGQALAFETDVGEIKVTLPADLRARLDASADIGDVTCDFDVDEEGERRWLGRSLSGRIGSGGAPLRAQTDIGQVRLRVGH